MTLDKTDTNGANGPDAFYKFTETGTDLREVVFSVCSAFDYDTYMRIYTNCNLNNPIENDDACDLGSEITLITTLGTTYFIAIEGYNGLSGNFTLTAACEGPVIPPPNDDLINAINIDENNTGLSLIFEDVNTQNASKEEGNPTDCTLDGFNGVWYKFFSFEQAGQLSTDIITPSGVHAVIFFEAPNLNPTIDQLVHIDEDSNPCFTGSIAYIDLNSYTNYFIFVSNTGSITDIQIARLLLNVETNPFENVALFPNPTSEILNIKNTVTIDHISIKNMLGASVFESNINAIETQISTQNLTSGT